MGIRMLGPERLLLAPCRCHKKGKAMRDSIDDLDKNSHFKRLLWTNAVFFIAAVLCLLV